MHKPMNALVFASVVLLPLGLAGCHPLQGVPPEGVRVVRADPGFAPHYGGLVTVQAFDHDIGVHGEVYHVDRGYDIHDVRWSDEGLSITTVESRGAGLFAAPDGIGYSDFDSVYHGILEPGFFMLSGDGIDDEPPGEPVFSFGYHLIDGADGVEEDICLVSWESPSRAHRYRPYQEWGCFLEEIRERVPTFGGSPQWGTATASADGSGITAVLVSEENRSEFVVIQVELRDEPVLVNAYPLDLSAIADGRTPHLYRMPLQVNARGEVALGVNWDGEQWALLTIDNERVEELFSLPIERDSSRVTYAGDTRQGFWKVFWAHDTWGAIIGEEVVLIADDGDLLARDIGDPRDMSRQGHPVWMDDGQLVITATRTLIVEEEWPILISATTHEIEGGTAPLVRSPKTARYGVQICAVPLDAGLREIDREECRVVER